jgi:predicted DNA-binding helix-hairpin-helix protein
MVFNIDIEELFELEKGWALKNKQKYGIRGRGKRMKKKVKFYLEGYFLAGNINKTDRMTAKEMVSQLQNLADEGEIQVEDIPEVSTVANWITRYAANMKKISVQMIIVDKDNEVVNGNNEFDVCEKGKKTIFDNSDNDNEHLTKRQKKKIK